MGILLLSRFTDYDSIQKSIMLNSSCILGVFGYLGLWSLLLEGIEKSIKRNVVLLGSAVLAFLLLIFSSENDFFNRMIISKDLVGFYIFIWPNIVAFFYIILLSKKLIQEKRKA